MRPGTNRHVAVGPFFHTSFFIKNEMCVIVDVESASRFTSLLEDK